MQARLAPLCDEMRTYAAGPLETYPVKLKKFLNAVVAIFMQINSFQKTLYLDYKVVILFKNKYVI